VCDLEGIGDPSIFMVVEGGLCENVQPQFRAVSDDGGLLPCLFRGDLGMRESVVSGSGRRQWFFFWVGGIGNGKRRRRGPWSSSYVHFVS
jgi:hypothetical protein